jgi:hypothetical protein
MYENRENPVILLTISLANTEETKGQMKFPTNNPFGIIEKLLLQRRSDFLFINLAYIENDEQ